MWNRIIQDVRDRSCMLRFEVERQKNIIPLVATPSEIRKINSNMRQLRRLVPTFKKSLRDPERVQRYYMITRLIDESNEFLRSVQNRTNYLDRMYKPVAEGG